MSEQTGITPEFAVGFRAIMLDGVLRELEITKKVIAAIPDSRSHYRHDPNARTAFLDGIADLNFKMATPENKPKTTAELVEWYDTNFKRSAARVATLTPQQLLTPVSFVDIFNFPAVFYLSFLNNHSIHHRGQLATYLRPMGAKVPVIYGGSFDYPFQPPAATAGTAA
jgi:uncharacterized damage-inducible protein DinB